MAALTLSPVDALPAWRPDPSGLAEVTALLRESTCGSSGAATPTQADLYAQLQNFATNPLFNNYLAYILASGGEGERDGGKVLIIRQAAGLLLKNNLKAIWGLMPQGTKAFVLRAILNAVTDRVSEIRGVAATCLGTVVAMGGESVDQIVGQLLKGLEGGLGESGLRGCLVTFVRVAEDKPDVLLPWMRALMERLLLLVGQGDSMVRNFALHVVNQYLLVLPPEFTDRIDVFLRVVFSAAGDPSPEVRARVCSAIVMLLEVHPRVLRPYLSDIMDFMLKASSDAADSVKYEAIEFWPVYSQIQGAKEQLRPILKNIMTVLVDGVVYSREEQDQLELEGRDDGTTPDREEDIHPRQFLANGYGSAGSGHGSQHRYSSVNGHTNSPRRKKADHFEDEDNSEDENDDDDIYDTAELQWSVRRSCARALEKVATVFRSELLNVLLPLLEEKLSSEEWAARESAILVLGAISLDAYHGMLPHLSRLIPYLVELLSDTNAAVRCISCWTLGRYARYSVTQPSILGPMLQKLLDCMLDKNKKVQKAAASALCDIIETGGGPVITPFLSPIIMTINLAFERYQTRNLAILYDLLSTLASTTGEELSKPEHSAALLPTLVSRWNQLLENDPALIPLLTCLGPVCRALGPASLELAQAVYTKCLNYVLLAYLESRTALANDQEEEFVASALDLICGFVDALGSRMETIIDKNLLESAYKAMSDARFEIRLAACGLIGEMAKARISVLRPVVKEYATRLVACLDPEYTRVSNNATWALGELVMYAAHCGSSELEAMRLAVSGTGVDSLARVMRLGKGNKQLVENTAICIGRLACVIPNTIEGRFADFAEGWFIVLRVMRDDDEKEQAFKGLCNLVRQRPAVVMTCFVYFCDAICSWWAMKRDLEDDLRDILRGISSALGENWKMVRKSLPETLQVCLRERFGL